MEDEEEEGSEREGGEGRVGHRVDTTAAANFDQAVSIVCKGVQCCQRTAQLSAAVARCLSVELHTLRPHYDSRSKTSRRGGTELSCMPHVVVTLPQRDGSPHVVSCFHLDARLMPAPFTLWL